MAKKKSTRKKSASSPSSRNSPRRFQNERVELLWRIVIAIISGIVLGIWRYFILVLAIIHFFVVLFTGKRDAKLANLCEYWNSELYRYVRYLTFATNERPFPFSDLVRLKTFEK